FQVGAVEHKQMMRRDRDGDHHVARAALAGHTLAAHAHVLAGGDASGDFYVDVLAGRQPQPPRHALGGFGQRDRRLGMDVGAGAEILGLEMRRAWASAAGATKGLAQDILEAGASSGACTLAAPRAGEALGTEIEGLKMCVAAAEACARLRAGAEAFEALKFRLPSASISPRSKALRLSASPTISC